MGLQAYGEVDYYVACNCPDDRTGHRQAEGRTGLLAYHLEPRPRGLHYESRMLRLLDHRIARSIAPQVFALRNK